MVLRGAAEADLEPNDLADIRNRYENLLTILAQASALQGEETAGHPDHPDRRGGSDGQVAHGEPDRREALETLAVRRPGDQ